MFDIKDTRTEPEPAQVERIKAALEKYEVGKMLDAAGKFLGKSATIIDQHTPIKLVDGEMGVGEKDHEGNLKIGTPHERELVETLQSQLSQNGVEATEEQAREIGYAIIATTIGHEKIHDIFDSKPGSLFWEDLKRVSSINDPDGARATLLDEGITYAIQGIYAPEIKPLGSRVPIPQETDNPEVRARKTLGAELKPLVQECLEREKSIDDELLSFASQKLYEVTQIS